MNNLALIGLGAFLSISIYFDHLEAMKSFEKYDLSEQKTGVIQKHYKKEDGKYADIKVSGEMFKEVKLPGMGKYGRILFQPGDEIIVFSSLSGKTIIPARISTDWSPRFKAFLPLYKFFSIFFAGGAIYGVYGLLTQKNG